MATGSSSRSIRRRRSAGEWVGRIALGCGISVLAYLSVAFSVAHVETKSARRTTSVMASYDGRLGAEHAAALLTTTTTGAGRERLAALSRAALQRDPTAVGAAATLGLVELARGDITNSRRLLAYSQMLSRRNVQTQLWSIEDAVTRNDIAGALRWYDITLRTKPTLGDMIFPVLTQAMRDPAIRDALIGTLAGRPNWADSYIGYAAGQGADPLSTMALFLGLRQRGIAVPQAAQAAVVEALLNSGHSNEAWRYYATLRPDPDRSHARDPLFNAMLDAPSLFDWTLFNDGNVSTSIQRTPGGGAVEFSAPSGSGGALLQQVQMLPPGTYRLAGHSSGIEQEVGEMPYWALICRRDRRELGRVALPNSAQAGGAFAGHIKVTADCPVQVLVLYAPPSDAVNGVSGQIDSVTLAPQR